MARTNSFNIIEAVMIRTEKELDLLIDDIQHNKTTQLTLTNVIKFWIEKDRIRSYSFNNALSTNHSIQHLTLLNEGDSLGKSSMFFSDEFLNKICNLLTQLPLTTFEIKTPIVHAAKIVPRLLNTLTENRLLTHLVLRIDGPTESGAIYEPLIKLIKTHPQLSSLSLDDIQFTEEETLELFRTLESNTRIVDLNLSTVFYHLCNMFWRRPEPEKNYADFLDQCLSLLANRNNLINLDLSFNYLAAKTIPALAKLIKNNSALQTLNLAKTGIIDDVSNTLGQAIAEHTALKCLNLSRNEITKCSDFISTFLAANTSITKLYLDSTELDDEGAKQILDALQKNSSLRLLHISHSCNNSTLPDHLKQAFEAHSFTEKVKTLFFRKKTSFTLFTSPALAMSNHVSQNQRDLTKEILHCLKG